MNPRRFPVYLLPSFVSILSSIQPQLPLILKTNNIIGLAVMLNISINWQINNLSCYNICGGRHDNCVLSERRVQTWDSRCWETLHRWGSRDSSNSYLVTKVLQLHVLHVCWCTWPLSVLWLVRSGLSLVRHVYRCTQHVPCIHCMHKLLIKY